MGAMSDLTFGEIVIRKGYATPEQVRECLSLQATSSKDPKAKPVRLGDLLMRKGYLSLASVEEVIREQTGHTPPTGALTGKSVSFKEMPEDAKKASKDPKRQIGKYSLIKEIGRGGMGQVFKSWDSGLNRIVALKILTADTSPDDIKRFFREAQTAAGLTHQHIAAVYDMGEQDGKYFIAMQFIDGKTLASAKMSPKRAAEVLKPATEAIEYAHKQKLVHRDIKPQNIMLDTHGHVYVLDFGLAKSTKGKSDVTQQGMVMGTPSYMAPEQAQGKSLGPRSDVYSLGATLYELVTGRPPFKGATPIETVMQVLHKDAPLPSSLVKGVPSDLELIILKCMEKDPKLRYPTAQALADELGRFLSGEAIHAQPPTVATRLVKGLKRNRALLPLIGGALLAAIAALIFLFGSGGQAPQVDETLQRADTMFEKGKFEGARALYKEVLTIDGQNERARSRIKKCSDAITAETARLEKEKEETERKQREADKQKLEADKQKLEADKQKLEADKQKREAEEAAKRRQQAMPELSRGKEVLDEAMKDLYRPGADLEASRAKAATAIERFDAALALAPDLADAYFYRGRAHQFRLDWANAEKDWDEALKHDPNYVPALLERGRYRMRRFAEMFVDNGGGDYLKENAAADTLKKLAVADFTAAKSTTSEQKDAVEAMLRLAEGHYAVSVDLATRALTSRQTDEELWKILGDAFYFGSNVNAYQRATGPQMTNLGKALEAYGKAIELRTNFPEARAMRAYVLQMTGRLKEALADIEAALKTDRRNYIALAIGATILGDRGVGVDPDRAIRLYGEGIDVKPDAYFCRVNRAVLLAVKLRNDDALVDLKKAIEINPSHMFAYQLKGALLCRIGNDCRNSDPQRAMELYREGDADLTKSLNLAPDFPATWYNRGAIRASMGRTAEALQDMQTAIDKGHPNPDHVREQMKRISK